MAASKWQRQYQRVISHERMKMAAGIIGEKRQLKKMIGVIEMANYGEMKRNEKLSAWPE
jgi:hypothetical protein